MLLDRDEKRGKELVAKLGSDKAVFSKVDVTSESNGNYFRTNFLEDVRAALELGVTTFGDLHGVVNCAGSRKRHPHLTV